MNVIFKFYQIKKCCVNPVGKIKGFEKHCSSEVKINSSNIPHTSTNISLKLNCDIEFLYFLCNIDWNEMYTK